MDLSILESFWKEKFTVKVIYFINGGTYRWPDGRTYEGSWVKSRMHGRGHMSFTDGRDYEGEFRDDKK